MENDRVAEMQAYLRREIADKNYDPEAFVEFISTRKNGGEDFENWSFEEVQQVVADFKKQHAPLTQPVELLQESMVSLDGQHERESIDTTTFGEVLIEGVQDMLEKLEPTEAEADQQVTPVDRLKKTAKTFEDLNKYYSERVQCLEMASSKLGQVKKLSCSISGERLVKGGFFSKSYTTYLIVTTGDQGTHFEVERRYSQFDSLRQSLVRDFPGVYIPPIARKQLKNYEETFLKNRFDTLKRFLQALAAHKVLKHSPHFEAFVAIKDEKQYAAACASIDKDACTYQFFSSDFSLHNFNSGFKAHHFRHLAGEFEAKINSSYHTLSLSSEQFIRDAEPVLQSLKGKLVEVDSSMDKVITLLSESSGLIGKLSSLTDKYKASTKDIQDSWDGMSSVFSEYQASVQHLGSRP